MTETFQFTLKKTDGKARLGIWNERCPAGYAEAGHQAGEARCEPGGRPICRYHVGSQGSRPKGYEPFRIRRLHETVMVMEDRRR